MKESFIRNKKMGTGFYITEKITLLFTKENGCKINTTATGPKTTSILRLLKKQISKIS